MVVESDEDEDDDDNEQNGQALQDADQEMADGEESVYKSALSGQSGEQDVDVDSIIGEEVGRQLQQEEEAMMASSSYGQEGAAVAAMM